MTFTEVEHGIFCCRTDLGVYVITYDGGGLYSWYLKLKTDAVSVGSYDDALIACREHLRAAYRYQQIVGRSKRTPIEGA